MPYIKKEDRIRVDGTRSAQNSGELNYLISKEIINELNQGEFSYSSMNDIVGILEMLKNDIFAGRNIRTSQRYFASSIGQLILDSEYMDDVEIAGAIENAKDEFQRRIQHPYENNKIVLNGDIYNEIIGEPF